MPGDGDLAAWRELTGRHLGRWQPRSVGHGGVRFEFYARRWGERDWTLTASSADDLLRQVEAAEAADR